MSRGPQYKVVILGEAGVGKTTLFLRLKDGFFHEKARTTCGLESCSKYYMVKDTPVRLDIWDTAGVERFRTMTANYYRHAHAVVFVYSVDNMSSIQLLPPWVDDSDNIVPNALKILVGNKTDLPSEVSSQSAQDFADIYNCECIFMSSAKTGDGVEDVFQTIAAKLLEKRRHSQPFMDEQNLFDNRMESGTYDQPKTKCCS